MPGKKTSPQSSKHSLMGGKSARTETRNALLPEIQARVEHGSRWLVDPPQLPCAVCGCGCVCVRACAVSQCVLRVASESLATAKAHIARAAVCASACRPHHRHQRVNKLTDTERARKSRPIAEVDTSEERTRTTEGRRKDRVWTGGEQEEEEKTERIGGGSE
jgi:hypothetical protein